MTLGEAGTGLGELDARFRIEAEIGRGAGSVVYAVRDRFHQARRALKLATRRGQAKRYRDEFRRLQELRHPYIVRSHDFGVTDDGAPYYTMELLRGVHLNDLAERREPTVVAVVASQLLHALATLHARGWVHRDVNPRNLLVAGRGSAVLVRLMDLGLVCPMGHASSVTGTVPYIAPEIVRGVPIDGRADLYALGVMLYECLAGEARIDSWEDAATQMRTLPPAPNRINPLVPAGLSNFIMRLLAPEPGDRFPDAARALSALHQVPGLAVAHGPSRASAERMLLGGAVAHRPQAMRRARRVAAEVLRDKRGATVLVEGPIGVGKTPFMRELRAHLNLLGFRVMVVRSGSEPGAPVQTLVNAAREIGTPELATQLDAVAMTRMRDVSAYAGRLAAVCARVFGDRPTALLLDDLHRAEPIALGVLRTARREFADVPVLLVCAADPRPDGASLSEVLGEDALRIALEPLTRGEVSQLVQHRLNGLRLPTPALERLVRDSRGMPSLVERTLASLIDDRTVRYRGRQFVFVGGRYRAAQHGDAAVIESRLARVDPAHRPLLWAAAVLEHELQASVVAAVAGMSESEASQALAELARLEILAPGEAQESPVYKFASRSLLNTLYQSMPVTERRQYHDRAARVLKGAVRAQGRKEERVEHLLKGSDDGLAVQAAIEAGDRAAAVYADRRAIEYYARAYARQPSANDSSAAVIALRLGKVFERTGELGRAAVWYQTALSGDVDQGDLTAIEATVGLGGVALVRGLLAESERHAADALVLTAAEGVDPRLRASATRLQALILIRRGAFSEAEALLQKALAALQGVGAEGPAVEVLLDLARLERERGEIVVAVRHARAALQWARRLGDPSSVAEATCVLGRGFIKASRFRAADRALSRGLRVSRMSGDRLREAVVLLELGNLCRRRRLFVAALEHYENALELVRVLRARAIEASCLQRIGMMHGRLGRFFAAMTALDAALSVANAIGDVQAGARAAVTLGYTRALVGDAEGALEVLATATDLGEDCSDPAPRVEAQAISAWVELRQGAPSAAGRFLADLEQRLEPVQDPAKRALVLVHACRSALEISPGARAQELTGLLCDVVERGALGDVHAAAEGLHGMAMEHSANSQEGVAKVQRAARAAADQGLRPLEVELCTWLGSRCAGPAEGLSYLAHAMEAMRSMVEELPSSLANRFISKPESRMLRDAFRQRRDQALRPTA